MEVEAQAKVNAMARFVDASDSLILVRHFLERHSG
jgi:hypothetical protein